MKPPFEKLIEAAKGHQIDTSAAEFGFETRILAIVRDLQNSEAGFIDTFGNWLWGSVFGLAPVVVILMACALFFNGVFIPSGTAGLVAHVVDALPFSDPTLLNH